MSSHSGRTRKGAAGTLFVDGVELRRARKRAGFSQEALSAKSGVSKRRIELIESGNGNVQLANLDALAGALSVDRRTLLLTNNLRAAGIRQNLDFVGRDSDLTHLQNALSKSDAAAVTALSGEGGIGKTQLAIRFAYRSRADYEGVWWVNAAEASIDPSMERLAVLLGCSVFPNTSPEDISAYVIRALSHGRHLLILDDVEQVDRLFRYALGDDSRLLATTRLSSLPSARIRTVHVGPLSREDAVALLTLHRSDLRHSLGATDNLDSLATSLGDHPFALALVGQYLRHYPDATPLEVLAHFRSPDESAAFSLLADADPQDIGTGYTLRFGQSLGLHLGRFAGTRASEVLRVLALCSPDQIPFDLVSSACALTKDHTRAIVRRLADVSIVRYSSGFVGIHQLMQMTIRARESVSSLTSAITRLLAVVLPEFENVRQQGIWPRLDLYVPHAIAVMEHTDRIAPVDGASGLASRVGEYLFIRARWSDAVRVSELEQRLASAAYGDDHRDVGDGINTIGRVHRERGELDEALRHYEQAEAIFRSVGGPEDADVAVAVSNIAAVRRQQGRLDEAFTGYKTALRIAHRRFGRQHAKAAIYINNLGRVQYDRGNLEKALLCFQRAKQIDEKFYGQDHYEAAIDMNNIGMVFEAKNDLAEALQQYVDAERITRKALGDSHPQVGIRMSNISSVLRKQGQSDKARKAASDGLRILLEAVGPRAVTAVNAARNLSLAGGDPLAIARSVLTDDAAIILHEELQRSIRTMCSSQ